MYCPPVGFESDPAELEKMRRLIADAAPDLVCVALGAPKQEIWMQENREQLQVGAMMAVGAALDTQAGMRRRAPRWIQVIALEWLYRLAMEPRRLWRRYLMGNARFVLLVTRQWGRERLELLRRRISKTGSMRGEGDLDATGMGHEED
jgi:N-acetylglucosaminyldiphosphoundecaprenol N-acetyl-beta-D-mannosaminyltransferase